MDNTIENIILHSGGGGYKVPKLSQDNYLDLIIPCGLYCNYGDKRCINECQTEITDEIIDNDIIDELFDNAIFENDNENNNLQVKSRKTRRRRIKHIMKNNKTHYKK